MNIKNKQKIVIIFPKDSEALFNKNSKRTFGGASVQMYLIAKELYNYENINTYSIILDYDLINFDDADKFNLVKIYKPKTHILNKIKTFHQAIQKIKPDVIIQRGLTEESCLLSLYCKIYCIKFIFMFAHDIEVLGKKQTNEKKILLFKLLKKFNNALITQNKYQQNTLLNKYKTKSDIIYNGFEIPKFFDKKLSTSILWVARAEKWKNPEIFINLAEKNIDKKFIMICPPSNDKNYFENIKNQAQQISNIIFIDFVPFNEINNYFKQAKIFINTSDYEGFPQTFIQSAINSVPILSLNVNPDNIFDDQKFGYCFSGKFNKLDNKLKDILSDKILYKKLSESIFLYSKINFNIKINVKNIINLV